ncbi:MAG: 50S ribosomal protein L10 [Prevotellaceae bacterium]|jgi:large subunit ribosomal protein L10|nr:50S ribosomal protein L10 [Prevotellaceae bacterium]
MKKEDKNVIIDRLAELLKETPNFYLVDISTLNAEKTTELRRKCFEKQIKLVVVKNTLLHKALEKIGFGEADIFGVLKGATSIMFTEVGNVPAKLIKEFRATSERPVLKAAYVQESLYIGDQLLDELVNIKSHHELVADVVALLQSPAKNVISALQSGEHTLAGLVKTLETRAA